MGGDFEPLLSMSALDGAHAGAIMTEPNSQMSRTAFLIAVVMVLILFIGLFVGYRWGAAAALRDNAAMPVATSPST